MKAGLYRIDLGNNCFYVGSSKNLHRREIAHKTELKCQRHHNPRIQKNFNKYGMFDFKVLMYCSPNDILFYEQRLLDQVFNDENCANICPQVEVTTGRKNKRTHCNKGHELAGDNVIEYTSNGNEYRRCKHCFKAYRKFWYRKKKDNGNINV